MGTEIKLTGSFDYQRTSSTSLLNTARCTRMRQKNNADGNGDKVDWQFWLSTHIVWERR